MMGGGPHELRAIVFDFDGVIVESGDIKTEAFRALFADRPDIVDAAIEHHLANLGTSRFEKFDWIFRELVGRALEPRERAELAGRYSELVVERVVECPLVPGALDLLEFLRGRAATAVASGTPQAELEAIIARRGLAGYFEAVHGSPARKVDILRSLLERFALAPREVLMVGDGYSDYRAASRLEVPFVLRRTAAQSALFDDVDPTGVDDLRELRSWLDGRLAGVPRAGPAFAAPPGRPGDAGSRT